MSFNASGSVIVHGFQAYYYELLRQKERALSLSINTKPEDVINDTQNDNNVNNNDDNNEKVIDLKIEDSPELIKYMSEIEGAIVAIQNKLIKVINDVSNAMVSKAQLQFSEDAKYVITALTDEIFINLKWEGADLWKLYLLEKKLFKTETAGDKFFEMADNVINSVNNEEIAFLYIMVLSLGFQGKYRDTENAEENVNWYKNKLYSILHVNSKRLFYPGRPHLIDSCYEHTIVDISSSNLPNTRYWSLWLLGVLFVYIIISSIIWFNITDDIKSLLDQITDLTRKSPTL